MGHCDTHMRDIDRRQNTLDSQRTNDEVPISEPTHRRSSTLAHCLYVWLKGNHIASEIASTDSSKNKQLKNAWNKDHDQRHMQPELCNVG